MTASVAERVRARLVADVDSTTAVNESLVARLVREEAPLLDAALTEQAIANVLAEIAGLGPLEQLLRDPEVSEVMVNGPGRVWVERGGALECTDVSVTAPEIDHIIEKIVGPLGLGGVRAGPPGEAGQPRG
jgi:pilus assembly protein CpaF